VQAYKDIYIALNVEQSCRKEHLLGQLNEIILWPGFNSGYIAVVFFKYINKYMGVIKEVNILSS
jgi:hypothetical protein